MIIRIDDNSVCASEIYELRSLLNQSSYYLSDGPAFRWTYGKIVSVAINELYDKLRKERKECFL